MVKKQKREEKREGKEEKKVLTVKELSERWAVPLSTIYNLIADETIPVLPLDGTKRILLETVEEMEYQAGKGDERPKTITERNLEKEKRALEKKMEEMTDMLFEIQRLAAECLTNYRK